MAQVVRLPPARHFSTGQALFKRQEEMPNRVHQHRVQLFNKVHLKGHKKDLFKPFEAPPKYDVPIYKYGCRGTGIRHGASWEAIPETVPELVVPDLTGCKLKPYVSYKVREITQEPLTSKDLFNAIYGKKILRDFKEGKLDKEGNSLEPSKEEELTPEQARIKARQTGSDIFLGGTPVSKKYRVRWEY